MTDHPITPPPELVQQWVAEIWHEGTPVQVAASDLHIANRAAQWGADQELEACVDVLGGQWEWDMLSQCTGWKDFRDQSEEILRAARRPKKQPGLAEQALKCLGPSPDGFGFCTLGSAYHATIRAALNRLKELEESSHD